jgi:hypothetical protein
LNFFRLGGYAVGHSDYLSLFRAEEPELSKKLDSPTPP